jgi:hypothetical protein
MHAKEGTMPTIALRAIAFTRSGDKGDTANIGVVPYDDRHYDLLRATVTVDRVKELFGPLVQGRITRYELPGIGALNFVLEQALGGGVSKSLNQDAHGKSFGNLMLRLRIEVPDAVVQELPRVRPTRRSPLRLRRPTGQTSSDGVGSPPNRSPGHA